MKKEPNLKHPLEKIILLHCVFLLLDVDQDNLVTLQDVNWAVLENTLAELIYRILDRAGSRSSYINL